MNLKKVKLIHETPVHYILHDGQAHFHVAKEGLDEAMHQRIQGFDKGGEAKLGTGKRFEKLEKEISKDPNVKDPGAVAAAIGRKKYGDKKFNALAHHNKMYEGGEPKPQPTPSQSDKMGKAIVDKLDPDKIAQFHPFAEGGEVDHNINPMEARNAKILNTVMEDATLREMFKQHFAGESDIPAESEVQPAEAPAAIQAPMPSNVPDINTPINLTQQEVAPIQAAAPEEIPPAMAPPAVSPDWMKPAPTSLEGAEQLQRGSIYDIAKEQANAAAKSAEAMKANIAAQQTIQNQFKEHLSHIEERNNQFREDLASNKIDPNHYWNSASTGTKISAALGLVLGSLGSGNGQPNIAAQFIENAIGRDIEAQKLDQSNKTNLYKMGLEEYHDTQSASTFATLQANTITQAKLQQIAYASQDPVIKAQANKLSADLYSASLPMKMQLAQRALALQISGGAGTSNINPEGLAPEYRERVVELPHNQIALAKTKEGAAVVGKDLVHYQNILDNLEKMDKMSKEEGRGLPFSDYSKIAKQLKDDTILKMNQVQDLNRLNEREFDTYKSMVPDPSSMRQDAAKKQITQLKDIIMNQRDNLGNQYISGFKPVHIKTGPPKLK